MEKNDHRSLAKQLDLYHIEEDAPGMVFWHPKGWELYRILEDFIRRKMRAAGYKEVRTPLLLPQSLWEKSGHWQKFGDNMFVVPRDGSDEDERGDMALKPMSCPGQMQIFNSKLRSWRDLPMRLFEFGQCHRNEPSGSLHGLLRSKSFEQDDSHVVCERSQIRGEVARFVRLLSEVYRELGFPDFDVALSLRPEVRAGSDEEWDWAEQELLEAAREQGIEPDLLPGEGAFYGPKLEFALKDRAGRSWQCGTIQLDGVLPGRLEAEYVGADSERHVPVMLHHAVLGSMGRFIGILLEHYEGHLPDWLAPEQVAILPVAERHTDEAYALKARLEAQDIRPVIYDQAEGVSRRVVMCRAHKVPWIIVLGDKEIESGQVAIRRHDEKQSVVPEDLVVKMISGRPDL